MFRWWLGISEFYNVYIGLKIRKSSVEVFFVDFTWRKDVTYRLFCFKHLKLLNNEYNSVKVIVVYILVMI